MKAHTPPIKIKVTSYEGSEIDKDGHQIWKKILSHSFYGETLKQAFGYAKSHAKSDAFFSSSFAGSMEWQGGELILKAQVEAIGVRYFPEEQADELAATAVEINRQQIEKGMLEIINSIKV